MFTKQSADACLHLHSIRVIPIIVKKSLHIIEGKAKLTLSLICPGSSEKSPPKPRVDIQRKAALANRFFVIRRLHLHQACGSIAVQNRSIRMALIDKLQSELVLLHRPRVVLPLESPVPFFLEFFRPRREIESIVLESGSFPIFSVVDRSFLPFPPLLDGRKMMAILMPAIGSRPIVPIFPSALIVGGLTRGGLAHAIAHSDSMLVSAVIATTVVILVLIGEVGIIVRIVGL
jgi:hypothetical protein